MRHLAICLSLLLPTACDDGTSPDAAILDAATQLDAATDLDAADGSDAGSNLDASIELDATTADAGSVEPGEWRLAPGHFHPAAMPMTLVYPRPDSETSAHARHRWAHPGVEYRIPAAVIQGGAWPFFYELIEAPESARVGAQLAHTGDTQVAGPDYGVVRWTPRASDEGSTFAFAVRVTDQEGATAEARWTVAVDASRFLFVSPSGAPGNPGTIDAPMRDVADWYRGDAADATFAGRLVYFRGGDYTPFGLADNGNLRMLADTKPMTFMAYPGEVATLDATRGSWTFSTGADDVFFSGLHFVGSKVAQPDGSPVANARNIGFYGTANHDRVTFFEVTAEDIAPGATGNDNPAFVWRPSSGARRGHYWAFVNNTFDTAGPQTSNGPRPVSLSCVSYVVYEGNTVVDWHGTGIFGDKASVDHETQRNNDLWEVARTVDGPGYGLGATTSNSYDPSHMTGHVEVTWNRIRLPMTRPSGPWAISYARGSIGSAEPRGPMWAYRNSVFGSIAVWGSDGIETHFEGNVVQGTTWRGADASVVAAANHWVMDVDAEVFDDASGALVGVAREDLLGTFGAEVR